MNDGGVQIMDVTDLGRAMPVFAASDGSGGFSALGGAIDAEVFVVGSRTYVAVAAVNDGGLQIMDVTDPLRAAPVAAVFEGYGGGRPEVGKRRGRVSGGEWDVRSGRLG